VPALLQVLYRLKISASYVTRHAPHISHVTFLFLQNCSSALAQLDGAFEGKQASACTHWQRPQTPHSNSHVEGLLAAHLETAPLRMVIDYRDTLMRPPHKLPQAHTNIFTGIQAPTIVNIALSSGRITLKVFTFFSQRITALALPCSLCHCNLLRVANKRFLHRVLAATLATIHSHAARSCMSPSCCDITGK
jgi:hypothetical protein